MIRVVTLDEFEPPILKQLNKLLYTAFAIGAEHSGSVTVPHGQVEPYDANKLLESLPKVQAFVDDKVLFLTSRKLSPRKLPSGEAPTTGLSRYRSQRSIVSTSSLKTLTADNIETVARYAMQEIGHSFGLHHCLDPRCAMYPPWTPSYPQGEATFCTFCRETSEAQIRLTKS